MKILFQLAVDFLKKNKRWTITSILSIVLASMLISVVVIFGFSFLNSLVEDARRFNEGYVATFYEVSPANHEKLVNLDEVENVQSIEVISKLDIQQVDENSETDESFVYYMDGQLVKFDETKDTLISGRLPEKENEVLLDENSMLNNVLETKVLMTKQGNFDVVGLVKSDMFFKVIGYDELKVSFYEDKVRLVEPTKESYNAALRTAQPRIAELTQYGDMLDLSHDSYMRAQMINILRMIGAFFLGIVILSSIVVINNTLKVASTQQQFTFGQLYSVGATFKQQSLILLFESLIIGLLGVSIGIGLGTLFSHTLINIISSKMMLSDGAFVVSYPKWILLVVFIVGILLVLVSSIKPILNIMNNNVIDSLKHKPMVKEKKVPRWVAKSDFMTRFAHMNYSISKKQFNLVLISITVAIIVYVSVSALSSTLRKEVLDPEPRVWISNLGDHDDLSLFMEDLESKFDLVDPKTALISDPYIEVQTPNHEYQGNGYDLYKYIVIRDQEFEDLFGFVEPVFINKGYRYDEALNRSVVFKPIQSNSLKVMFNLIKERPSDIPHDTLLLRIVDDVDSEFIQDHQMQNVVIPLSYALNEPFFETDRYQVYFSINDYKQSDDLVIEDMVNNYEQMYYGNMYASNRTLNQLLSALELAVSLFALVITLISFSNIYNTLTTQFVYRSKEFSLLEAMGATKKQLRKMVLFESLISIIRAVIWGTIITVILFLLANFWIKRQTNNNLTLAFPWMSYVIIMSLLGVGVLLISLYALGLLNKQNLVDKLKQQF